MTSLDGDLTGLKTDQTRRLRNLLRRRVPGEFLVTPELARDMGRLSHEIGRQVGLLIDRSGHLVSVMVGDAHRIVIPDTPDHRTLPGRLKGLRCVHTHLRGEDLTDDDFTDLAQLRLDLMAAVLLREDGEVRGVSAAHLLPKAEGDKAWRVLPLLNPGELDMGCQDLIRALEDELTEIRALYESHDGQERAILVSVTSAPRRVAEDSLAELTELARSGGIHVVETVLQSRRQVDARFLVGRGKLQELNLMALQKGVSALIFDQELNASQIRSITDQVSLKVLDRTQLILDIFAQRAQTREGKLQVELAQLKYLLPRLVTKNTAMSRLTGGIGGRGPGETKLEINRRRARDRINQLERDLDTVVKQRGQRKSLRQKKDVPVLSIVGYTNAGKSTLLNTLTQSKVVAEDRLFATLDPSSRRLRFPHDIEVIVTDTVGFIRDLPKDLVVAFRATLEELRGADILLHVIDAANPRHEDQIASVERILQDLELDHIPTVRVLNKMDLVPAEEMEVLARRLDGLPVSATDRRSLRPLIEKLEGMVSLPPPPDEPQS